MKRTPTFGAVRFVAGVLLILFRCLSGCASESWADPRLAVTNGLEFWFDASRQNPARLALGRPALKSWSDGADYLFDGSGHRRDLAQPFAAQRPRFRQEFSGAMLSFDGQDDSLFFNGTGLASSNLTVFVVAAPTAAGGFQGVVALTAAGQNDYRSGFNLDWGGAASTNLSTVNSEGAGFSGERNLLGGAVAMGRWHCFCVSVDEGTSGVTLSIDGRSSGARERSPGLLRWDEFTLGARKYSNTDSQPSIQSYFRGDWAETLVYSRVLSEAERHSVDEYLRRKYLALLGSAASVPSAMTAMSNPPPVQVLIPGFAAEPLPVDLNNINNVAYRPDGVLVASGYDGRVWLIRDTNGDGVEDKAELFWDSRGDIRAPIGMALTPPGYARGNGVFLAAKDKVVLLVDTNRDDRADAQIVVATWTERSEQQGVDALGVAVAPDQSIYFSLGAASFTDGYVTDRTTGRSRFPDLKERGTIQHVSADFSKRETVCTGIRFAVGMDFNRNGDLFCTDQEGATWLPNGNPFDELLQIQTGRHYGFPPRHPRLLPNVIDEPSVFDYAPQHESTCGLHFNESIAGGPAFGSPLWAGDALVSGYSRGKIWRTKLVKTAEGYVADSQLMATLQQLVVDTCNSPRGDLIVAAHSGKPDWGSGPNGKGTLWRIHRANTNAPIPVVVWSESATEVRVAFDRPVEGWDAEFVARNARLEAGEFVFPGDRFEGLWPGYQVVHHQKSQPRFLIPVQSASWMFGNQVLALQTSERQQALHYAVTLSAREGQTTDLAANLNGLIAEWWPDVAGASVLKSTVLPHLDLAVAQELTRGSAEHFAWFQHALSENGLLRLSGQLDLYEMLQPAIQPGASVDYTRPPEIVTVRFRATQPFRLSGMNVAVTELASQPAEEGWQAAEVTLTNSTVHWLSFAWDIQREGGAMKTAIAWKTADDSSHWRAFPVRRFLLPWVKPVTGEAPMLASGSAPEIAGGNWLHGRRLFFSDKLGCARCHTIRNEGGRVGPDLSNLIYRDYASVRKDIEFPNAAINPDHVASLIETTDGELQLGIVLSEANGVLAVADASGIRKSISRVSVKSLKPAPQSLMPEGLWAALTSEEQRDLMTFLLSEPLAPHPVALSLQGLSAPRPRAKAEYASLIPEAGKGGAAGTAMKIILCASPKDAGHSQPGFHDYPLWQERWTKLLALADGVSVEKATSWPSKEKWATANVVVFYHDNPAWQASLAPDLDAFLKRGGGLVFLHWSLNSYKDKNELAERIGRTWAADSKFKYGPEELRFSASQIVAGFKTSPFVDEAYWKLSAPVGDLQTLVETAEDGEMQPQVWTKTAGAGRVFVCIPGHFTWTHDDPLYRVLVLRGIAWSAGQPLDRLTELAPVGARFGD
ncbi:MAG TPA: ThuA domain-containing protein [Candidatus Limnocylindria bacterium]|nr:ThuA domain-containing protein [Candidatus Limnocylindria bacterium]